MMHSYPDSPLGPLLLTGDGRALTGLYTDQHGRLPSELGVWQALREIRYGCTMTYRQVAERLGNPKAVRAVGSANSRNPISIIVPCHRVLGSDGKLIGYTGDFHAKRWLLDHELRTAGLAASHLPGQVSQLVVG